MRSRQRGATFIGMVVIIAILGLGLYAVIRLTPLYLEYMAVARALDGTAKEFSGNPTTAQALRTSLDRRWTVADIKSIEYRDVEVTKADAGYTLHAAYRAEAPFIANVSLVVDFDTSADVTQ